MRHAEESRVIQNILKPIMPDPLKSALWYAEKLHWSVLPMHTICEDGCTCGNSECDHPGKHPTTPGGFKDATQNSQKISDWWKDTPWNVAVATGSPSGVWVLDVDGEEGKQQMANLVWRHGKLPLTVTSKTGGGGLHLYWRLPKGRELLSRTRILPGVDVKANGGCAHAPPSLHESGLHYEWMEGRGPHETTIAEAPEWLVALALRDERKKNKGRQNWAELFRERIGEGARNDEVTRRAGYLIGLGMGREVAAELLLAWNGTHCLPPLGEREILQIVKSIDKRNSRGSKDGGR